MNLRLSQAVVCLALGLVLPVFVHAQQPPKPENAASVTVFENVRVFDGKSSALSGPTNVLVRGNKIERISAAPIATDRRADTLVIDGGGRTLMPGLLDAHWHAFLVSPSIPLLLTAHISYLHLLGGQEAGNPLMRGFISVRDAADPNFGLKRAIDSGLINGPRIWPQER
jgi:imidazolonepropionase-like amidohydrolase